MNAAGDPGAVRTLVARCLDWPIIAAGRRPDEPAAVLCADRVLVTSPAARVEGVQRGQRRRDAQRRCPELIVLDPDPERESRVFASIVALVDRFTPRVELSAPGRLAFPVRGASRLFGGDDALARLVADELSTALGSEGWADAVGVGVADGVFTAERAASVAVGRSDRTCVVAPGGSAAFLAPLPVSVLGDRALTDVLRRLGLVDLGAFAALDPDDVMGRFGEEGRIAHRRARGLDERPPQPVSPPAAYEVELVLDPPAERADAVAFAVRGLAERFERGLAADSLACTRISIVLDTETGERLERVWRNDGALRAAEIVDRVRWQLDGWTSAPIGVRPTGGVERVALIPDEFGPAVGRQEGFWGGTVDADARAARALARVQAMVGPGAVTVPEHRGGRGPAERVVRVPFSGVDRVPRAPDAAPWPGRVPPPAPVLVMAEPVEVLDARGALVVVSGRGELSSPPARLVRAGRCVGIEAWAGPWVFDERWWAPLERRRRARLQLVLTDRRAVLVHVEGRRWVLEGIHD